MTSPESYLSYFTPGQMSHETLEFILVKRQKLIDRLVERVRHSVLSEAKHQSILLGPRGMGKSHVVALVYYRVKALSELSGKIALAWLAEEEWGVASLTDLFLVILKALAREYPETGLQPHIDALYRLPHDQIGNAASQKLRDFAGDRTLFLIVENLEEIFRGLGEDGQWAFRSFLNEHPFITILATTPSLFPGIQKQEQAFYGFFQPTYLDELNPEEAAELLGKVAARRGDTLLTEFLKTPLAQDRVQAVHDLAGGHPRIYLLFAHLITQESLDELVTPFLQLLDELTPYYQSRMQLLSPQQRKITEYLCDRRGAITVKDLAAGTLITPQSAATQLGELDRMGYVRKTAVGRESFYELREPLLRMVIEMKRGRGEPLRLVIDFLRRWYSRRERTEWLANVPQSSALTRQYLEASLDLERAQLDDPNPLRAEILSPVLQAAMDTRNFVQAAECAAEIIERKGRSSSCADWLLCAQYLYLCGNLRRASECCAMAINIDPESAYALSCSGMVFEAMCEYVAALECYDKAIRLKPDDAAAWNGRGTTLNSMKRHDEALQCFDNAIDLDPKYVFALSNKGITLSDLGQNVAALRCFDAAIELEPRSNLTWSNRGVHLRVMGRLDEALSSFDKSIEIDPICAFPWFNRGSIFLIRKQWYEFLQTLNHAFAVPRVVSEFGGETTFYCGTLLRNGWPDEADKVSELSSLYSINGAVTALANGLTTSMPVLFEPEITQAHAEQWLAAWTAAGEGKPDFEVPLRLLAAAVAWNPKRDVRALLALPIEERRILEQMLPADAVATTE